jgi:hypothetical protein
MDTPTPPRKPTDIVDVKLTPQGPPNGAVLAELAKLINEGVEQARKKGPPKLNLKLWEPPDPDEAPPPLADALGQAEDAILAIAAASQQRAAELAEAVNRPPVPTPPPPARLWARVWRALTRRFTRHAVVVPEPVIDPAIAIRAAEEQLRKTVAQFVEQGIVPVAEAVVESPVVSERES